MRCKNTHTNNVRPKFTPKSNENIFDAIEFDFEDERAEFVFVGEFLYWTRPPYDKVRFVKVLSQTTESEL